ncbi:MAG TPA: phage late control D family protein, partial [Candidatus Nanopelagicales bacterium]|nr:phage late control D family protein [Candidatus Nanopelagicales bacterium]
MSQLCLVLASGGPLEVHRFSIREEIAALFTVKVLARSPDPALDLRALLGQPAALHLLDLDRRWSGVCNHARLVQAVDVGLSSVGLSTYEITLVPRLWLLTQRTRYRIFQHLSIPAIARALLDDWSMTAASRWSIREDQHPPHPYRVQYGETDHHFLSRLLEEAGIATTHDDTEADTEADASVLVLSDALHETALRREPALQHIESPTERSPREWVTRVSIDEELRP